MGKFESRIQQLESEETECGLSSFQYKLLLILYLAKGDITSARLLWKRSPKELKETDVQFISIWNVCRSIVKEDFEAVFNSLSVDHLCVPPIKEYIEELREAIQLRQQEAFRTLFTKISIQYYAKSFGIDQERAIQLAECNGWKRSEDPNVLVRCKFGSLPKRDLFQKAIIWTLMNHLEAKRQTFSTLSDENKE
ncbi:COP9 signalosome complex subunit 8 [Trichinella zimbabwensis]|uniref:COP9 signalosome complex subunit 8 n=1 Tax=Trichinella zimbabwensis TaxID=268475 RepID=A0A0V1HEY5_9BILA|nr:COP9 signalosome complex subunit 8 [Trichinella zimbabwensis]